MLSMNEKIAKAAALAIKLADRLNDETLQVDQELADLIWGHADGLSAKRLYDLRDGRCSLAASMAFDQEEEEAKLDEAIETMGELLDDRKGKHGRPY